MSENSIFPIGPHQEYARQRASDQCSPDRQEISSSLHHRHQPQVLFTFTSAPSYRSRLYTHTHTYSSFSLLHSFIRFITRSHTHSLTHSVHSNIRWLPDENSSSASHVASEGCLRDREVSPRRSVRREREDRTAIGWKRTRRRDSETRRKRERAWDRGGRERRYWIGDTAWEVLGSSLL